MGERTNSFLRKQTEGEKNYINIYQNYWWEGVCAFLENPDLTFGSLLDSLGALQEVY